MRTTLRLALAFPLLLAACAPGRLRGDSAPPPRPEPAPGTLVVQMVNVSHARSRVALTVSVDGAPVFRGRVPLDGIPRADVAVSPGRHVLRVADGGGVTLSEVEFTMSEAVQWCTVTYDFETRATHWESIPEKADVRFDSAPPGWC